MNDGEALLRGILEHPECDIRRLVYADWLDEHGEGTRAGFIRAQIELARYGCKEENGVTLHWRECHRGSRSKKYPCNSLRRQQRELWRTAREGSWTYPFEGGFDWFRRGFMERVTCSVEDWLRFAESLYWRPGQTRQCPVCGEQQHSPDRLCLCKRCSGKGHIPRPCPPTAQPVTTVRLSDWPEVETARRDNGAGEYRVGWKLTGDPVPDWCLSFEMVGLVAARHHDKSLPQVVCEARWPGIFFELPNADRQANHHSV